MKIDAELELYILCSIFQEFTIDVTTVDDDTPILQTNLGIHYLEYDFVDGKVCF